MLFIGFLINNRMKYSWLSVFFWVFISVELTAQSVPPDAQFITVKTNPHTSVKNQASSSTCWSFAVTSLLESQAIKNGIGEQDLSEMFTVRNTYIGKARNYMLRQGAAQFGSGGLGHDVINSVEQYGMVPESVYSGILLGKFHDHGDLDKKLKAYLDDLLKSRPVPADWMTGFQDILDEHLGKVPETFNYREKVYTPLTFAKEVLKFKKSDYVFITSFNHHPFYSPFILEIPDNYANASYYNIPLNEMLKLVDESLTKGYSVMWNADVSNPNFRHKDGLALLLKDQAIYESLDPDVEEAMFDQQIRQQLFERLITQDDHLTHIVGLEMTKKGKKFFLVKNSWGESGPFKGYIKVSEAYFAINTITIILPKAALNSTLKTRLNIY
jgi:bleomycin hydrolase